MSMSTKLLKIAISTATIMTAVALGDAHAAPSTPIVYDGVVFLTALSSGCAGSGLPTGLAFSSTYRPKISGTSAPESIDVDFKTAAALITATNSSGSLRGSATFTTTGISDRAFAYSNSTSGKSNLTFVPTNITASTLNLTMTGTISDLYGAPSCMITVRGVYTQRP